MTTLDRRRILHALKHRGYAKPTHFVDSNLCRGRSAGILEYPRHLRLPLKRIWTEDIHTVRRMETRFPRRIP
jgi:hypothetical protein